jgi:hypothetical protein
MQKQTPKPAASTPRRGARGNPAVKEEEPVVEETTGATTRRGRPPKRGTESAKEEATPKKAPASAKQAVAPKPEAEAPASPASKRRGGRRGAGSSGAEVRV